MKTRLLSLFALSSLLALPTAFAETLGNNLPTANINTTNGLRSNVSWSVPNNGVITDGNLTFFETYGDSFQLGAAYSGSYNLSSLTLWVTDATPFRYTLYVGTGDQIEALSSTYSLALTTYANGEGYLSSSGNYLPIYQLTFNFSFDFNAADTVNFALAGWDATGAFYSPSILASNAANSGSVQTFANDAFSLNFNYSTSGVPTSQALLAMPDFITTAGNGWDKNSDLNFTVNVTANPANNAPTPVPEASTYGLLGATGLLSLAGLRRLRQRKAA